MRIAIHANTSTYTLRWIEYCKANNVSYDMINCLDSDIIHKIRAYDGVMWHWIHSDPSAQLVARNLLYLFEKMGIHVFPDFDTCWHYDDKIGQKYLLDSISAPVVPSRIFYDRREALDWIKHTEFPKVFKLRGGAGSQNVFLVRTLSKAEKLINQAFGRGFVTSSANARLKERFWLLRRDHNRKAMLGVVKGLGRMVIPNTKSITRLLPKHKGYAYFQDFVPNNSFDDRIVVVGNRAFAVRRMVRTGDFRASGSGIFSNAPELFNGEVIALAFRITQQLNAQTLAYDIIYNENGEPLIIEMSYAYVANRFFDTSTGYWDRELTWHDGVVNPQYFMIEDFVNTISRKYHK